MPDKARYSIGLRSVTNILFKGSRDRIDNENTAAFVTWSSAKRKPYGCEPQVSGVGRDYHPEDIQESCDQRARRYGLDDADFLLEEVQTPQKKEYLKIAPIGLLDMFNAGGAIESILSSTVSNAVEVIVTGRRRFGIYATSKPQKILQDGKAVSFIHGGQNSQFGGFVSTILSYR